MATKTAELDFDTFKRLYAALHAEAEFHSSTKRHRVSYFPEMRRGKLMLRCHDCKEWVEVEP